jgi:hypothetical protein
LRILQNRHVAWLVRIRAFALATAALIVGCGTASSVQHVALNDPPSPLSNSKTIAVHAKLPFSVVPQPRLIVRDRGYYVWKSTTTISMPSPMPHAILDALVTVLKDHSIAGSVNGRRKRQADIKLQIDPVRGQNLGREGYALAITPNSITATANAQSGLFYAVQTLDQLILNHGNAVVSPTIRIRDWPRFRWREVVPHFRTANRLWLSDGSAGSAVLHTACLRAALGIDAHFLRVSRYSRLKVVAWRLSAASDRDVRRESDGIYAVEAGQIAL